MGSDIDLSSLELSPKETKILEAVINISNEKGFSSTTTSEIAKKAGIAEGTIFRYFPTKKDILHGVLLQAVKVADKLIFTTLNKILDNEEQKDMRTILKEILLDRLALVQKFFPMFRFVLSEALFHNDIREALYSNLVRKLEHRIIEFYKTMAEKGEVRSDIDPTIIVRSIVGSFAMFVGHQLLFKETFQLSEHEKEIDDMITLIMDGISPKK